ncbi:MAG: EscU/YscU/HrcU family type III secretion system export apparatus switch protein, partial [Planctomycetota bacterium]
PIKSGDVPGAYQEVLTMLMLIVAPTMLLMVTLVLASALAGYAQIGFHFSTEVLQLKIERLNPASNWKRILNLQGIVRTSFALVKLGVLVAVISLVLKDRWVDLTTLPDQDFVVGMRVIAELSMSVLLWVAVVVFLIAAADVIWQRFDFQKRNMMTKQEVEDERKRSEGDPMIKSRLRQARTELLKHRMMQAIPKADVVITNPTHYAVALRYDRTKNVAPEVVAKGVDDMAARIREIAREHKVPLMEDPPLARALFRAVKVGQEIPARFFEAVATVLSHVYRLKNRVA